MALYRVLVRPTGLINGRPWPVAGDTIELPANIGMPELEELEEIRPAPEAGVETRKRGRPRKAV